LLHAVPVRKKSWYSQNRSVRNRPLRASLSKFGARPTLSSALPPSRGETRTC
jgi:hypothetical protein